MLSRTVRPARAGLELWKEARASGSMACSHAEDTLETGSLGADPWK